MSSRHNFKTQELNKANAVRVAVFLEGYLKEASVAKRLTYSFENSLSLLHEVIDSPSMEGQLIFSKDILVGFAAFCVDTSWFEEKEGYIEMFYIHPEARASGASRVLADCCITRLKAMGVAVITTTCESGISELNNKLYRNLFLKKGFDVLGTTVRRFL